MRLHIVRLLPLGECPAQRTRRTNAFAAARGDKKAMRPLAKLLLTLVVIILNITYRVFVFV